MAAVSQRICGNLELIARDYRRPGLSEPLHHVGPLQGISQCCVGNARLRMCGGNTRVTRQARNDAKVDTAFDQ